MRGIDTIRATKWYQWLAVGYLVLMAVFALFAPLLSESFLGFAPNELTGSDLYYTAPGSVEQDGRTHLLGTDRMGRDVATRLIYGTRTALFVGLGVSVISLLISLVLGLAAGYYGDRGVRMNSWQLIWIAISAVVSGFYSSVFGFGFWLIGVLILIGSIAYLLGRLSERRISVPIDLLTMKGIEIFKTIPGLFLILSLFAIMRQPGMLTVILILGLVSWPAKTRIVRAETMRLVSSNFIKSAQLSGLSDWRILHRHILPNVLAPISIAVAYTFTGAILAESTLSFLGIGLPEDIPSWGAILREARDYFAAWWLAVFPGLAVFFTVLTLNIIADWLNQR